MKVGTQAWGEQDLPVCESRHEAKRSFESKNFAPTRCSARNVTSQTIMGKPCCRGPERAGRSYASPQWRLILLVQILVAAALLLTGAGVLVLYNRLGLQPPGAGAPGHDAGTVDLARRGHQVWGCACN